MRLIDADALQELCNRRIQNLWNCGAAPASWSAAYADFKDDIDSVPTFTSPNEPLTLKQLRQMDGEPVWVVVSAGWKQSGIKDGWRLVGFHVNDDRVRLYMFSTRTGISFCPEQDMGRSYWVYRRPPEEEE